MELRTSLRPLTINKDTWVYLEGCRVDIIHELKDEQGNPLKTISIKIPQHKIKKWLKED